jgi:hypothetical protein
MVLGGTAFGLGTMTAVVSGAITAGRAADCESYEGYDSSECSPRPGETEAFVIGSFVASAGGLALLTGALTYGPNLRNEREQREREITLRLNQRQQESRSTEELISSYNSNLLPDSLVTLEAAIDTVEFVWGQNDTYIYIEILLPVACEDSSRAQLELTFGPLATRPDFTFTTVTRGPNSRSVLVPTDIVPLLNDPSLNMSLCNFSVPINQYNYRRIQEAAAEAEENNDIPVESIPEI